MAKEVEAFIKLQVKGGAANPSPPIGPALGSKGVGSGVVPVGFVSSAISIYLRF